MSSGSMRSRLGAELAAEIHAANEALDELGKGVCLFGGARVAPGSRAWCGAYETAKLLSELKIPVFTGGGPGVMEAGNAGARAGVAGKSVALNITLPFEQQPNSHQDIAVTFEHFASRKVCFTKFGRGFVYFAGGFGTLDELGEIITLIQTGKIQRLPVILYDRSFWAGFIEWLRFAVLPEGLISEADLEMLVLADSPEEVLAALGVQMMAESV